MKSPRLLLLLCSVAAAAQSGTSIKTRGQCSGVTIGNNNVVNCGVLSKTDAEKLAHLLNELSNLNGGLAQVLANQDRVLDLLKRNLDPNEGHISYEVDGLKRITSAGYISVGQERTPQFEAYQQMNEAFKNHQYAFMEMVAQKAYKDTPEWKTPLYMMGIAMMADDVWDGAHQYFSVFIDQARDKPLYGELVDDAQKKIDAMDQAVQAERRRYSPSTAPQKPQ